MSTPEQRAKWNARYAANRDRISLQRRVWYLANRERVIVNANAYQKANREAATRRQAAWVRAHPDQVRQFRAMSLDPEAVKARQMLNQAVRYGRVDRQPCEMCGTTVGVHGHHPFGYQAEYALAVWWLCRPHHQGMHQAMGANQ